MSSNREIKISVGVNKYTLQPKDIDRFHNSYKKKRSGCWEWSNRRRQAGYGCFVCRIEKRRRYISAHRLMYLVSTGVDPGEMCVLHRCDNPPCVNPDHLWLGTNADNVVDRMSKGRQSRGAIKTHCKRGHALVRYFDHAEELFKNKPCNECELILRREKKILVDEFSKSLLRLSVEDLRSLVSKAPSF